MSIGLGEGTTRLYPRPESSFITQPSLSQRAAEARVRLDAHVREIVQWHFDPATGCPFWLEHAAGLDFDPRKEIGGYADLALRFGERSLALCLDHNLDAFVTGFAHEAIARAAAEVDDIEMFTEHLELAKERLAEVEDPEERDLLEADLAEMSER